MEDLYLHDFTPQERPEPPGEPYNPISAPPPPPRRRRKRWPVFVAMLLIVAGAAMWVRYGMPVVTEAVADGYVVRVDRRGIVMKTWEGEMVPVNVRETDAPGRFTFSVTDDSLARSLQKHQGTGRAVRLVYEVYRGTLPWRGSSRNVVTAVREVPD